MPITMQALSLANNLAANARTEFKSAFVPAGSRRVPARILKLSKNLLGLCEFAPGF